MQLERQRGQGNWVLNVLTGEAIGRREGRRSACLSGFKYLLASSREEPLRLLGAAIELMQDDVRMPEFIYKQPSLVLEAVPFGAVRR